MRLLLADDDRQRYSAWYRDYGGLQTTTDGALATTTSLTDSSSSSQTSQQQVATTRSQHLLHSSSSNYNNLVDSIATFVDLQIALITPLPVVTKPVQVKLTRRNQCSQLPLRTYGSLSGSSSSSMPSTAFATASSAADTTPFINRLSFYFIFVSIVAFSIQSILSKPTFFITD